MCADEMKWIFEHQSTSTFPRMSCTRWCGQLVIFFICCVGEWVKYVCMFVLMYKPVTVTKLIMDHCVDISLYQQFMLVPSTRRGTETQTFECCQANIMLSISLTFSAHSLYRGFDKSLAWHDWKNNWKVAIFCPMQRSLLPWRPGWMDNLLNCFLHGLQKLEFGHCSSFPSWWG